MTINEAYKICKENLDNAYTIIPAFIKAIGNEYEIKIQEEDLLQNENNAGINIKIPINENFSNFKLIINDLDFILYKNPFFQFETNWLQLKSIRNGSALLTFSAIGAGYAIL